jgi:hypothetical protein
MFIFVKRRNKYRLLPELHLYIGTFLSRREALIILY